MTGAGLDESVGNLEQFIERLGQASAGLEEVSTSLDGTGRELDRLESEAQDTVGGLTGDVEDAADAFQQSLDDVRDAIQELAEAAEDGGEGRLADVQESLEEATTECEEQAASGQASLDEVATRLAEAGYDAHVAALEQAGSDTQQADDAHGQAFEAFEASLHEGQERVGEASEAAVQALGGAASGSAAIGDELTEAFTTITSAWHESVDTALRDGCEEVGAALATAYASWTEQMVAAADALASAVEELFSATAGFVGAESVEALEAARTAGLDDPSAALLLNLDQTQATLESGQPVAETLEGVVPDLQRSLGVVDEVERLLSALV